MATTIQVSQELVQELKKRKFTDSESYEEIIWDLIEDTQELSEQTKKDISQSIKEIERGEFYTHEQVKKELRIK
jgi:predicted transcriptional regulator